MVQRIIKYICGQRGTSSYLQRWLLLIVVLIACACSNGSGKSGGSGPSPATQQSSGGNTVHMASFDPCTLFSKDAATRILGGNISVLPEIMAPLCRYAPASSNGVPLSAASAAQSNEILVAVGSSNNARSYFALDRSDVKSSQSKTQDVKGIGDAAFTVDLNVGKAIVVSQANTVYSITIIYPGLAAQRMQSDLLSLARQAQGAVTRGLSTLPVPHPDPCATVNAQDARKILLNQTVSWFFTVNSAGVASCDYISSQGASHRIQVISLTRAGIANALFKNASTELSSTGKKVLKGLGDQAFTDGQNSVWILKGNTFFHMIIEGIDPTRNVLIPYSQQAVKRF